MNAVNRAPAGGVTSVVNGWRYEGGQFTPDHGKSCGKGKNRVALAAFEAVAARVAAAGKVLSYDEAAGRFVVKYPTGNVMMGAASLATLARCF